MNEKGFNFKFYDPFSQPARPGGVYDVVTAFEVIEHSANPLETLRDILKFVSEGGCAIISQSMIPRDIEFVARDWWYMAPRNGHISFFSDITMQWSCDANDLVYGRSDPYILIHRRSASLETRVIKENLGIVTHTLRVGSPARGYVADGWHQIEVGHGVEFRWTGQQSVEIGDFPFYQGMTVVEIPFLNVSSMELTRNVSIEIDGTKHRAYNFNGVLRSVFLNEKPGHQKIVLLTGPLAFSGELGENSDMRMLGLAVISNEFLHGRV